MTLCKGDHIVKLDKDGKPLTTDREMYIEYVVEELTPYLSVVIPCYNEARKVEADIETVMKNGVLYPADK